MRLSDEIRALDTTFDPETGVFLDAFDEPEGCSILEVGAHDSKLSFQLASAGFEVTSIDLRPYDSLIHHRHTAVVGDFGRLQPSLQRAWSEKFDCVVSISALEHFGLGTYEEKPCPLLDAIACRRVYDCLKPGGVFYIVVPFGGKHVDYGCHWRVYDSASLMDRIIQDFVVEWSYVRHVETFVDAAGVAHPPGSVELTRELVLSNASGFPGFSILVKMRKPLTPEST